MFTGIITAIGSIRAITKTGDWTAVIAAKNFTNDLAIGASVSCNGACLTVTAKDADSFTVQISKETISCTTLGKWEVGFFINLERALKIGDELGGHFVSGHVDCMAVVEGLKPDGDSKQFTFSCPPHLCKFIAPKGSITIDGVSLTVNQVKGEIFSVNVIPHTLTQTTLGILALGSPVNLEVDLLARYLGRLHE